MTSRERVNATLSHRKPDRIPRDFGSTGITGLSASFLYKLRQHIGLAQKPIRIYCPYQMLGEVDEELREWMGVDVASPWPSGNLFGYDNTPAVPFTMPDGTPVLVPEAFNTEYEPDGSLFMYAGGDRNYAPSAKMPAGGNYFDTIIRAKSVEDDMLDPNDNLAEFSLLDDTELRRVEREVDMLYKNTDYALIGSVSGTGLGDIAFVAGPMLSNPKGVRDIEEWYISPLVRPDYVKEVFSRQMEIALTNLKLYHQAVGDKISVLVLCGADFGSQIAPMLSVECFREFYLPYYRQMTDWIHQNTKWKIFKHSCGAIEPLLESFIEAGIDIINPVQCSAVGMEPAILQKKYGSRLVFWGGGVDTQHTLPFGTPQQVRDEVKQRLEIFGQDGGFVFNTIHNVQADVPPENFVALIEALNESSDNI